MEHARALRSWGMRAVVQRAMDGHVLVAERRVGGFAGLGLVVLLGVTHTDTPATASRLAERIWHLRIFERPADAAASAAREWSAADIGAPVLVISQFTLYGQTSRGRRPTWERAAPAQVAEPLVGAVVASLRTRGAQVSTGVFGADMQVCLVNVGPMTIVLDIDEPQEPTPRRPP